MPPPEKPKAPPTLEELSAMNRKSRRNLFKKTGLKLFGTTKPYVRAQKKKKRK